MGRQQSMAAITRALNPPPSPDTTVLPALPSLTAGEKRAIDVERADRREQMQIAAQDEKLALEENQRQEQERLQAERKLEEQEQLRQSQLEQAWASIRQNIGKVWDGTKTQLESLPTPGSLLFPLIILLVFFLLLIPVNGHTRLVWIWLVLTGNAEISGSNPNLGGIASGSFADITPPANSNSNGSNGSNPGNPPLQPFVLPSLGTFMTGVQEPL